MNFKLLFKLLTPYFEYNSMLFIHPGLVCAPAADAARPDFQRGVGASICLHAHLAPEDAQDDAEQGRIRIG